MKLRSGLHDKKAAPYLALFFCCLPMFFINVHDAHSFGDDWAQYLQEALNIAQGKPFYQSAYIFNPQNIEYAPPQYPPGYPLLLAPIVAFTGKSILPLIIFNCLLVCLVMFAAFGYFKKYTSSFIAVCLAVVMGYLPSVIDQKGQLLSDLPCLLFSLLYLLLRADGKPNSLQRTVLLILVGTFNILIRSQAVVIVFTEAMIAMYWLLHIRRNGAKAMFLSGFYVCAGITALFCLFNFLVFAAPESTLGFYGGLYTHAFGDKDIWQLLTENFTFLFDLLREAFYQPMNDKLLQLLVSVVSSSLLVFAVIGGLVMLKEKRGRFSLLFFALMCGLILLTPVFQGIRYFWPAIPVFILLVAKGLGYVHPLLSNRPKRYFALICTVLFIASGYDHMERAVRAADWGVSKTDFEAFEYVSKNVPKGDIVVFSKPRLLTLYSGSRAMNISWSIDAMDNRKQFGSMGVDYLLYCKHLYLKAIDSFKNLQPSPCIDSVKINEEYTLYRLDSSVR